jgi:hypothetical protein
MHKDTLDGAAADGAGFAPLMSNFKIEMGCAQFALGADVGIHAGAFAADGCPPSVEAQHPPPFMSYLLPSQNLSTFLPPCTRYQLRARTNISSDVSLSKPSNLQPYKLYIIILEESNHR